MVGNCLWEIFQDEKCQYGNFPKANCPGEGVLSNHGCHVFRGKTQVKSRISKPKSLAF